MITAVRWPASRQGRRTIDAALVRRGGFTLFEILLVLVVLVTVLSLTWPVLDKIHSQYRLRQGGQLVQVRLAAARVQAINSGLVYQFRYEPGGQRFVVLPFDQQALSAQPAPGTHGPRKLAGKLPSARARFEAPHAAAGMTGAGAGATGAGSTSAAAGVNSAQSLPAAWLAGIPDVDQFTDAAWSQPILFYPDGSASQSLLTIRDGKSDYVTVSVRSLTGSISVSKIERGGGP